MVTLLNGCGLALRADDPAAMKAYVLAVHGRAAEAARQAGERQAGGQRYAGTKLIALLLLL